MSYLESKSTVTSFKECIISFWFRIPSQSLAAVTYDYEVYPSPVFNGILPLLVMGEEGQEEGRYDPHGEKTLWTVTDFKSNGPFYDTYAEYLGEECHTYHDFTFIYDFHCCLTATRTTMYTAVLIGEGEDYHNEEYKLVYSPTYTKEPSNPTSIGVDAEGHLYVNFQTNKQPKITNDEGYEFVTSITSGHTYATSGNIGYSYGPQLNHIVYDGGLLGCVGLVDSSTVEGPTVVPGIDSLWDYKAPEEHKTTFPILPYETGKFFSGSYETNWSNNIKVSPDHWHHVLVSVKLQTTKTHNYAGDRDFGFEGGSLLYIALDDKNYTKEDLSDMWDYSVEGSKFGPNEVFPDMAWDIATDHYNPGSESHPQVTYELTDPQVPSGYVGLPATNKYVKNIQRAEMAELQIWFEKSFDTGDVANRRLFISSKGKPVRPEEAEAVLGKPDILLHGSNKWKKGINTGTLAPPSRSGPPEPWFTPTPDDGIVRWKPDPSLHGPQRPNEKESAPQGEA